MLGFVVLLVSGLIVALAAVTAFTAHRLRSPPRKTYTTAVARQQPGQPDEHEAPRTYTAFELDLGGRHTTPVWSIDGDDPTGPIVIATPGWGDSRVGMLTRLGAPAGFEAAAPGLATRARRVIAWDPPGQGDARGRCVLGTREPTMLERLVREVIGAEAAEAGEHDPVSVVLFGSSLGAGVSIVTAALAPPDLRTHIVGVLAEAPYRLPVAPARNVIRAAGYPTFPLPFIYLCFALRFDAGFATDWPRVHAGQPFDRAHHARRVSCPLLVLHGTRDTVSPPEDGRTIAAAAPLGESLMIEHAGHNNLWTDARFSQRVGEATARFVERAASDAPNKP